MSDRHPPIKQESNQDDESCWEVSKALIFNALQVRSRICSLRLRGKTLLHMFRFETIDGPDTCTRAMNHGNQQIQNVLLTHCEARCEALMRREPRSSEDTDLARRKDGSDVNARDSGSERR